MLVCGTCGFKSSQVFRFCPECGVELAAATPSGEQRRVVTVLFCDLTGSTALGESHARYERKGNLVLAGHARERLAELKDTTRR